MTVIVYRDGIMAADSGVTHGGMVLSSKDPRSKMRQYYHDAGAGVGFSLMLGGYGDAALMERAFEAALRAGSNHGHRVTGDGYLRPFFDPVAAALKEGGAEGEHTGLLAALRVFRNSGIEDSLYDLSCTGHCRADGGPGHARGSGYLLATGALFANANACEAAACAAQLDLYCRPPVVWRHHPSTYDGLAAQFRAEGGLGAGKTG